MAYNAILQPRFLLEPVEGEKKKEGKRNKKHSTASKRTDRQTGRQADRQGDRDMRIDRDNHKHTHDTHRQKTEADKPAKERKTKT